MGQNWRVYGIFDRASQNFVAEMLFLSCSSAGKWLFQHAAPFSAKETTAMCCYVATERQNTQETSMQTSDNGGFSFLRIMSQRFAKCQSEDHQSGGKYFPLLSREGVLIREEAEYPGDHASR
jgi:hypothetical protein